MNKGKRSVLNRITVREVRKTFGRFFAIFAIIALGAGFFSGLRITSPTLVNSMDKFYQKTRFFDYRLVSDQAWDEESVSRIQKTDGVLGAQGTHQRDVLVETSEDETAVFRVHTLTDQVNKVSLKKGRLPEKASECLLDASFPQGFKIGDKITFSKDNKKKTLNAFKRRKYIITGLVDSPLYINWERGTSSAGNGSVAAFLFVKDEVFKSDIYEDIYVKLDDRTRILSDRYTDMLDKNRDKWKETVQEAADERTDRLVKQAKKDIRKAKKTLTAQKKKNGKKLAAVKKKLDQEKAVIDAGNAQLAALQSQIAENERAIREAEDRLPDMQDRLDSLSDTATSRTQAINRKSSRAQKQRAADARSAYRDYLDEYNKVKGERDRAQGAISSAKATIASKGIQLNEATAKYQVALGKYNAAENKYEKKVAAAEKKIKDGQEMIDGLKEADVHILERESNLGYNLFENDSQIVKQVASVFPLFFILVAVLVCATTMTRMVEEQRGQIGILRGLGYTKRDVTKGFMYYSGSAALIGCILGYTAGTLIFPAVIWRAYHLMYIAVPMKYTFSPLLFLGSLAAAMICSLGTSWYACRSSLSENAASLLRPRAPKPGKRIILEYIPALWDRLPFIRKVSMRNIFRYRKRLLMMILGISGSMALLLTGFGLKDSIEGFAQKQYDTIQIADAEVSFKGGEGGTVPEDVINGVNKIGAKQMPFVSENWDLLRNRKVKSVNLIAPYGNENIHHYFVIRDMNDKALELPKKHEALISISLAERYGLKKGDYIKLRSDDMDKLKVHITGIFENHVANYVIVSPKALRKAAGKADVNAMYLNFQKDMDPYEGQAALAKCRNVVSIQIFKDLKNRLSKSLSALDYVVLLVIICAALLAFVVVYNLTNINIIERIREIATIKVLGFYRRESADYILRENIVLTVIGAIAGIFLGIGLHRFVMSRIVVDMVYFPVHITVLSYVYSVVLTLFFTILINLIMSFRMDRVNMAESLKAVE